MNTTFMADTTLMANPTLMANTTLLADTTMMANPTMMANTTVMADTTLMADTTVIDTTTPKTRYDDFPDAHAIERTWCYLVGIAGTFVGSLGIVCNCLSLGVLCAREMRSTTSLYLIAMAIYDLVFLLVNTVFISMDYFHFGVTGLNDWHEAYVSLAQPFVSAFTNVAITGSVYTTVILSIDRTIGIQFPLQWHRICSSRRVKVALCAVFFTSAILNVPMMMEDRWEYHTKEWSNVTEFQSVSSEYSKTYFHNEVYLRYINPIFDAFVPVIAISTINVIIARSLHQRSRLQKTLISSNPTQDLKSTETKRITSMVICISLETLMTRTTRMINFIIQGYYGTAYVNACPLYCGVIAALAHFLTITNATFNFFCFCYFGSKFRRCFLQKYLRVSLTKTSKTTCEVSSRQQIYLSHHTPSVQMDSKSTVICDVTSS